MIFFELMGKQGIILQYFLALEYGVFHSGLFDVEGFFFLSVQAHVQ